nr:homeobox-leucine zipper protein ATHB-52-like [Coffea arabica]
MDSVSRGNGSDDEVLPNDTQKRKNHNNRTSRQVVQQLEELFKNNPRPSEEERNELGEGLGLGPKRITTWFQNKRSKTKIQTARAENVVLREENERIQLENAMIRERLRNTICPACESLTIEQQNQKQLVLQQLLVENAQLREEVKDKNCTSTIFDNLNYICYLVSSSASTLELYILIDESFFSFYDSTKEGMDFANSGDGSHDEASVDTGKKEQLQNEREENDALTLENEKLRMENLIMRGMLMDPYCTKCHGGLTEEETRKLHLQGLANENAKLKKELDEKVRFLAYLHNKRGI